MITVRSGNDGRMASRTRSDLTRGERTERAFDLFSRGYSNADVARKLRVHRNTAANYRVLYEEKLKQAKLDNPAFLQDILGNTLRLVGELEQIQREAWRNHEKAKRKTTVECPHCEKIVFHEDSDPVLRDRILNTLLKAQSERAKLMGVIGVKAEFMALVAQVKAVQDKLLTFMATELCEADREKLDRYLSGSEMSAYMGSSGAIEAESWEEAS